MKDLTILAYHRVHPGRRGALCVTPHELERQMRHLLGRGARPLGGADLIAGLAAAARPPAGPGKSGRAGASAAAGPQDAPAASGLGAPAGWGLAGRFAGGPAFLVTFDDGYADFARHAWPVLKRLRVPALVFLIHDWVGRREPFPWEVKYVPEPGPEDLPLGWAEVLRLRDEGCAFGSHTLTHPDLDGIEAAQARVEIATSRSRLQERLGMAVDLFCYPRGRYSQALAAAAAEAGYAAALLTPRRAGLIEHRYCLRRIGVYAADRGWRYRLKVSAAFETLREARLRWIPRGLAFSS